MYIRLLSWSLKPGLYFVGRNTQTLLRKRVLWRLARNGVYTPASVAARIYADLHNSGLRTISERWIYFISTGVKACVIRRGRGRLANDNTASAYPGQQNFKRRAKVSVKVGVWWKCSYSASARSLWCRSVLVTERACTIVCVLRRRLAFKVLNPALVAPPNVIWVIPALWTWHFAHKNQHFGINIQRYIEKYLCIVINMMS